MDLSKLIADTADYQSISKPDKQAFTKAKHDFYLSLQRILEKKADHADAGLHDAINDLLKEQGLLQTKHYYDGLKTAPAQ
ncbi:hypothetical protein G3435_15190 [Pseudomonas sp. MAFF212428]|uniref:Uncharacterized protein n=1 Tax=Pseudomonas brassicae TaxID=2708063 RepID=A0A6B3NN39_9PSED|nr:hypothetical protein [Pseudomonas brassicae]NER60953.1 hypothetical protein [Pseudomonas brassicae]NER64625.1 hypothetical protein [Pseudomonas brassicae]